MLLNMRIYEKFKSFSYYVNYTVQSTIVVSLNVSEKKEFSAE
jgi:hypothetical protein